MGRWRLAFFGGGLTVVWSLSVAKSHHNSKTNKQKRDKYGVFRWCYATGIKASTTSTKTRRFLVG